MPLTVDRRKLAKTQHTSGERPDRRLSHRLSEAGGSHATDHVRENGLDQLDDTCVIPVQVHRYDPGNRGWLEIMKTGPVEFNKLFLWRWKQRWDLVREDEVRRRREALRRDRRDSLR
jgi:hypothetical protein